MMTPKHLGQQSQDPIDTLDLIPWDQGGSTVTLHATEFTSHCPVTKQPDFAQLVFTYTPKAHLVETKSFKLWLWKWRSVAQFNEKIVAELAQEFYEQVKPLAVKVEGRFNIRGGISVTCEVCHGE